MLFMEEIGKALSMQLAVMKGGVKTPVYKDPDKNATFT